MFKKNKPGNGTLRVRSAVQGKTIEQRIEHMMRVNEPITDGAPQIYSNRKDGVLTGTDIRADRWEMALDEMDKATKSYLAKRDEAHTPSDEPGEGGGEQD